MTLKGASEYGLNMASTGASSMASNMASKSRLDMASRSRLDMASKAVFERRLNIVELFSLNVTNSGLGLLRSLHALLPY